MSDISTLFGSRAKSLQAHVTELLGRFKKLSTFQDAAQWDNDAKATIDLLIQYQESLSNYRDEQDAKLKTLQAEEKPLFEKIFSMKNPKKDVKTNIIEAEGGIESVDKAIEKLLELIEKTPTDRNEQKQILNQLMLAKRELTMEKRQVNESMRLIRVKARQDSTAVARWTAGKLRSSARTVVRTAKESKLEGHEIVRGTLEQRSIELEKSIHWISGFSGNDDGINEPQEFYQPEILRCAYCGRRVEPNQVCGGCGATEVYMSPL